LYLKYSDTKGVEKMAISIKAARVNAGLTQEQVAKALKKSKNTIVAYEAYTSSPDITVAIEMAELFGMSLGDIIWNKE
jgi:DNA-binding XRE family transcriptional regulator